MRAAFEQGTVWPVLRSIPCPFNSLPFDYQAALRAFSRENLTRTAGMTAQFWAISDAARKTVNDRNTNQRQSALIGMLLPSRLLVKISAD